MNNEVKLKQFVIENGVFGRVQALSPYPFFDTVIADDLDQLLVLNYGQRIVYNEILNINIDLVINQIVSVYHKKWTDLINVNSLDITVSSQRSVTELNDSNVINTGSASRENRVSAYNTDELITDKKDIDSNTNTVDNLENKTLTEKRQSFNVAYNNLILSDKLNIINIVLKDVSKLLTLDIY